VVRSTPGRAAARGLAPPCEVGGPLWVGLGSGLEDVEPADERMARAETQLVPRPSWSGLNGQATNRGSQPVHPADEGESSRSRGVTELCKRIELALPAVDQTETVWLPPPHPTRSGLRVPRMPRKRRRPCRPAIRSVGRRGRRRSQGAMTDQSWFEPFFPHQRAKCPQPHRLRTTYPLQTFAAISI